jgi:hypothetical protein
MTLTVTPSVERYYVLITINTMGIIHRPVFYLNRSVSEAGFCLLRQEDLIEGTSLSLRMPVTEFYF